MTAQVITHPAFQERRYLAERTEDARRYVADLEHVYAGLLDGTIHWADWNEELTCPDRQDAAVDECGMALDAARAGLAALEAQASNAAPGGAGNGETR